MQNKISVFTIIGFSLSLLSILTCDFYYLSIILVVIPAVVFCFIGIRKGNKVNKALSIIGAVIGLIMFFFTLIAPTFIRVVKESKEQIAIEQSIEQQ